jgi:hypothetical protein
MRRRDFIVLCSAAVTAPATPKPARAHYKLLLYRGDDLVATFIPDYAYQLDDPCWNWPGSRKVLIRKRPDEYLV